jgi:hypothetical protein
MLKQYEQDMVAFRQNLKVRSLLRLKKGCGFSQGVKGKPPIKFRRTDTLLVLKITDFGNAIEGMWFRKGQPVSFKFDHEIDRDVFPIFEFADRIR